MASLGSLFAKLGKDRPTRIKRGLLILAGLMILGAIGWSFAPQPVAVDLGKVAMGRLEVTVDDAGQAVAKLEALGFGLALHFETCATRYN